MEIRKTREQHQLSDAERRLFEAAERADAVGIAAALAAGADINTECGDYRVLHYAAATSVEAVAAVLEHGPNLDATNFRGQNALFYSRDEDIIYILLAAGVDPDQEDMAGNSPAMLYEEVQRGMRELRADVLKCQLLEAMGGDEEEVAGHASTSCGMTL